MKQSLKKAEPKVEKEVHAKPKKPKEKKKKKWKFDTQLYDPKYMVLYLFLKV